MRTATKLALLCAAALVALALGATNASAQTEGGIEIRYEETGLPCDPCKFHATNAPGTESELFAHTIFGPVEVSHCAQDEFEGEIYHQNGDGPQTVPNQIGHITTYTNEAPAGSCTRINCNGAGEDPSESEWPISNAGEFTGDGIQGNGHMTVRFCLDDVNNPGGAGEHCDVEVQVSETAAHEYRFSVQNFECTEPDPNIEVSGTWDITHPASANHDDIEIVHDNDPDA